MTTYYTVSGAPVTHSFGSSAYIRTEFTSIQTAFGTVNSEMITKGAIAGQAWTGNHTFPTQSANDNSTKAATTAYVDTGLALKANIASPTFTGTVTIPGGASISGYALLASPAFTGVPTAPTASTGTGTTQIATCAFVGATAFNAALPSQTGNSGKFVTTDGSNASWAFAGVSQVTTATTATTLTSTPTLLKITPTSYGVTVTLPDATTCSVGGPLHIIDNRGAYPVRVCDSTGVLKAFVFAGVVSHISLDDNSTAAGVWAIENGELVGASAQLLTTNMALIDAVIDIGSSQEVIIGRGVSSANCYGVVYNRSTNTFGSVTLIRTATFGSSLIAACLSAANQVLVVSTPTGAATFEAVTLSISGTTITVNTAATATLSANMSAFADGCGLIAVGSSFVASYTVATPAAQIRALSISGTTVTIGSATVLDGTAGGLIAAAANHVIAVSTATTSLYTKPYLVSGSTLTAGTGTNTSSGTQTLAKLAALDTRWYVGYSDGGTTNMGGVVSLNATGNGTTTISTATLITSTGGAFVGDAVVIGSNKVLVVDTATNNVNILTDTAGTASAGTAIAAGTSTGYILGTDGATTAYVYRTGGMFTIDCSGASPVVTKQQKAGTGFGGGRSNAVLAKPVTTITGTALIADSSVGSSATTGIGRYLSGEYASRYSGFIAGLSASGVVSYRGKSNAERWASDAAASITKLECAL